MALSKRFGWALLLLALAFPAAAHTVLAAARPVLAVLVTVAVVLLTHPPALFTALAALLLASILPGLRRRAVRSRERRELRELTRGAAPLTMLRLARMGDR